MVLLYLSLIGPPKCAKIKHLALLTEHMLCDIIYSEFYEKPSWPRWRGLADTTWLRAMRSLDHAGSDPPRHQRKIGNRRVKRPVGRFNFSESKYENMSRFLSCFCLVSICFELF